jgi:ABC-2 type transport system permease protein
MLADAIAAETYKFLRQRSTLFWGFCAVPLALLAWDMALAIYLRLHAGGPMTPLGIVASAALRIDAGQQIVHALQRGDSAFFKIFFTVGAAGIFANEYRWETWRLLTPRNSRFNLLAAKFTVYAMTCAAGLAAMALSAALGVLFNAALNGAPLDFRTDFVVPGLGMFAISWTALMVLGAFVALVAVTTRATTGALLAGVVFCFVQAVFLSLLSPWTTSLRYFALVPELPAEVLRGLLSGQQIAPGILPDTTRLVPAILVLLGWIGLMGIAALVRFQRQDLPRE